MTIAELREEICRGSRAVLLVRHAERPKMDPNDPSFGDALSLTYEGVQSARKLGEMLKDFKDDVQFYASPLTRTRMTAACIAEAMGVENAEIPTDELLGNGSFYYDDPSQVLDVFKPKNFFPACFEYFRTAHQRGFRELYSATNEFELWLATHFTKRLFVVATHDLYVAAFLYARKAVEEFTKENWLRFLDGGAIILAPDGTRRYALIRSGLSRGIVGVHKRQVRGVVFDFGGVMTSSTMPERVRKCVNELGIDWKHLEVGFAKYRRLMDGGFMTIDQMYDLIWADADIKLPDDVRARILEEDYASFLDESRNLKTLAWMKALKARGFKIGILSNMSHDFFIRFQQAFPDFIEVADAVVISGEEAMYKPQRRIYDLVAERIGLTSEQLCFIDDAESNCEGARNAGWAALRFESNAQIEAEFEKLIA